MRATKRMGDNYLAMRIDQIGPRCFYSFIKDAIKISDRVLVDDYFNFEEPPFSTTQIPYSSGYVQERYVYYITRNFTSYILKEAKAKDAFEVLFNQFLCWDFYHMNTLILSINIPQNLVSVNSLVIDLIEYGIQVEEISEDE
jgi:hypothetical protein